VAQACAGLSQGVADGWEELGAQLAGRAVELAGEPSAEAGADARAEARVTRIAREIERRPGAGRSLAALADEAGLSPYHFLRTFRRITGVTPHQFLLRLRLRDAALRLVSGSGRIIDVALDAGFGDLSNFNRAFRVEFGAGPREYRRWGGRRPQE
jgi:AraC-like DNA-binding protein